MPGQHFISETINQCLWCNNDFIKFSTMTAPRIARANRLRLFLGLGIFVLVMGFIAVFHSSQTELDEMKLHCAKQQDSLNSQLTGTYKKQCVIQIVGNLFSFFFCCCCVECLHLHHSNTTIYNSVFETSTSPSHTVPTFKQYNSRDKRKIRCIAAKL